MVGAAAGVLVGGYAGSQFGGGAGNLIFIIAGGIVGAASGASIGEQLMPSDRTKFGIFFSSLFFRSNSQNDLVYK